MPAEDASRSISAMTSANSACSTARSTDELAEADCVASDDIRSSSCAMLLSAPS
jgi:hypothetical protein